MAFFSAHPILFSISLEEGQRGGFYKWVPISVITFSNILPLKKMKKMVEKKVKKKKKEKKKKIGIMPCTFFCTLYCELSCVTFGIIVVIHK